MMPQSAQAVLETEQKHKQGYFSGRPGPGRPKGSVPVKQKILKDCLMMAGEIAGNKITKDSGLVGYLVHLALNKPDLYVSMLAKIIPMQVQGAGADGALEIRWLPPQEPPKVIEHEEADDGR
jgi:hypothetical protein